AGGHVFPGGMLAELKRAHGRDDGPAALNLHRPRIARHGAEAARDHVEDVAFGHLVAQTRNMETGRSPEAPADDHAFPAAVASVANAAIDVKPLLPAADNFGRDLKRERRGKLSVHLARVE